MKTTSEDYLRFITAPAVAELNKRGLSVYGLAAAAELQTSNLYSQLGLSASRHANPSYSIMQAFLSQLGLVAIAVPRELAERIVADEL